MVIMVLELSEESLDLWKTTPHIMVIMVLELPEDSLDLGEKDDTQNGNYGS